MNNTIDLFYKKSIPLTYEGEKLLFRVTQDLFSSHVIDHGTQRLLRTISSEGLNKFTKALDLGCGYGPIGLTLKKLHPSGVVHMVDIDALVLEYARQNAVLNNIHDVRIYASLGYDNVTERDFDLIVSNIPAKVGERVLSHILQDARHYLRPTGCVAVVVIDAISTFVGEVLKTDDHIKILFQKSWPGHIVFHYTFIPNEALPLKPGGAFSRGLYDRADSESDTPSFETKFLLDNLDMIKTAHMKKAIVFNPGKGYIPLALSRFAQIDELILADRNLQALEVSKRNLLVHKYPANKIVLSHRIDLLIKNTQHVDCIIGILPEKQNIEVYKMLIQQSVEQLLSGGILMFAASSTVIKRVEEMIQSHKSLVIVWNKRSKGKRIILARQKTMMSNEE